MDDQQVLHMQIIENLQRDDLHHIEEAEGYERLMQESNPNDSEGGKYTAEAIAAEIGKSRSYVFNRRKLLDLCQDAREAFFNGDIDASTAELIARIPVEKLQLEALQLITAPSSYPTSTSVDGDKISFRKAREILREKFMLDLAKAPFDIDDAALMPKAGSCTACAKRTGNQPELFDDVSSKDVCTDTTCFAMKKEAGAQAKLKQLEDKGSQIIPIKQAKKMIPNSYEDPQELLQKHGYYTLNTKVADDEKGRNIGKLLKEKKLIQPGKDKPAAVTITYIENPHKEGHLIEAVSIEAATKALREAGCEITIKTKADVQQEKREASNKQREEEAQQEKDENAFRSRLFNALHTRIEADMLDQSASTFPMLYRMMATKLFDEGDLNYEDQNVLVKKYSGETLSEDASHDEQRKYRSKFIENIQNLTPAQHLTMIVEMVLMGSELTIGWNEEEPVTMLQLAKDLDIDAEALRKTETSEIKNPEDDSERLTIKTAKFGLLPNEHGVYTCAPDETFEWKQGRQSVTVELLELENNKWIYNIDVHYKDGSVSGPLSYQPHNSADSRESALQQIKENLQGGFGGISNFKGTTLKSFEKWLETFPPKDDTKPATKTRPACTWPFPSPGKMSSEVEEEGGAE